MSYNITGELSSNPHVSMLARECSGSVMGLCCSCAFLCARGHHKCWGGYLILFIPAGFVYLKSQNREPPVLVISETSKTW